jgi:hypothetical protein
LNVDPNDPRLNKYAEVGFTLTDVPEAEVVKPEVTETTPEAHASKDPVQKTYTDQEGEAPKVTTRVGVDPNDARLVPELDHVNLGYADQ